MGITQKTASKIELLCLCVQSSNLFGMPHELLINISKNSDGRKTLSCKCSCVAGSPHCKHIIGALNYLLSLLKKKHRNQRENIEVATCTDINQKWGKLRVDVKTMYSYVPISQHCHGKQSDSSKIKQLITTGVEDFARDLMLNNEYGIRSISLITQNHHCPCFSKVESKHQRFSPSSDDSKKFLDAQECRTILSSPICQELQQNTGLYIHTSGEVGKVKTFGSLSEVEKAWYAENIQVDLDTAVELCLKTRSQSGGLWRSNRRERSTGATFYGYITPLRYNNERVNQTGRILGHLNDNFKGNEYTAHGIKMEPKARACYAEITGLPVKQVGSLVNPRTPWLLVSLDGIVFDSHTIEIKCPNDGKTKPLHEFLVTFLYIKEPTPGSFLLKEKQTYYCQVRLGMFVANLRMWHFLVYSSYENKYRFIEFLYDPAAIDEYLRSLLHVYFQYMLKAVAATDFVSDIDLDDDIPNGRALGDITKS
ncbi:hypothetical protein QAD02_017965 [Eretmocerus hayati]|uniref:Uncharacterized protein n=1 Tax=Eretmocerus hayati TaxID=131215 RepID=A0ACC2PGI5_9HYME|nr:hypothetical protein QAD02_017965 [Eretmocerus hayati]